MAKTLIAFLSPLDPSPTPVIEGVETTGPLLDVLRSHPVKDLVLLITPESLSKLAAMEAILQSEMPQLAFKPIYLPLTPHNYKEAQQSLTHALRDWREHDVLFLPDMHAAHWYGACLLSFTQGYLRGKLVGTEGYGQIIPKLEWSPLTTHMMGSVHMPNMPMVDDAAKAVDLVGNHPKFNEALETATAIAQHSTSVLILGETGTGKDAFARFIHLLSNRNSGPFVAVNCATLPEALAESVLFGHLKGAFPGATQNQPGKFKQAHMGTLFLDEIGELPLRTQAKLIRIIEEGIIDPIGSNQHEKVDVRVIAATNRSIPLEIKEGRFREDLYYRLRAGEFSLPPLRERKSDISKIALHLLTRINRSLKEPRRLHPSTIEALEHHNWPGNIRDLQNVLERAAILNRQATIMPEHLRIKTESRHISTTIEALPSLHRGFSIESYIGNIRRQLIQKALSQSYGNQSEASRLLGITPQAVNRFVRENGR